jgi:hypothetical protein
MILLLGVLAALAVATTTIVAVATSDALSGSLSGYLRNHVPRRWRS